ncbi:unnamed protein product, partial [marine sediment metagenome]
GTAEQNKVLTRLMEVMEQGVLQKEEIEPKVEKVEFPPGCYKSRRQVAEEEADKENRYKVV